jgi:hypothetical protein
MVAAKRDGCNDLARPIRSRRLIYLDEGRVAEQTYEPARQAAFVTHASSSAGVPATPRSTHRHDRRHNPVDVAFTESGRANPDVHICRAAAASAGVTD